MTQEQITYLKEVFDRFDKDGSGRISASEILQELPERTYEQARQMIRDADINGDGQGQSWNGTSVKICVDYRHYVLNSQKVSFEEFLKMMSD